MVSFPDFWSIDTSNEELCYGAMAPMVFLRAQFPTKSIAIAASNVFFLSMFPSLTSKFHKY